MAASTVLYQRDGRIARITLNRPEKLNAINDQMPQELRAAGSGTGGPAQEAFYPYLRP